MEEEAHDLFRIISQQGLCPRREFFFLIPTIRL